MNVAILPCAGVGRRFGSHDKLYKKIGTLPILIHTLDAFVRCKDVHTIILAIHPEQYKTTEKLIAPMRRVAPVLLVHGGKRRQDSVRNGLKEVENWKHKPEIVVVHDGARPFVTPEMISKSIREAKKHGSCIVAVPLKDTLKEQKDGFVEKTVPREKMINVQTPQAFRHDILKKAFEKARKDNFTGTDESALVERLGVKVKILNGSHKNIKITTEEDLLIAQTFWGQA